MTHYIEIYEKTPILLNFINSINILNKYNFFLYKWTGFYKINIFVNNASVLN